MPKGSEFQFTDAAISSIDEYLASLRRSILTTAIAMAEGENQERIDAGLVARAIAQLPAESPMEKPPVRVPRVRRRLALQLASLLTVIVLAAVAGNFATILDTVPDGIGTVIIAGVGLVIGTLGGILAWSLVPARGTRGSGPRRSPLLADSAIEFLGQWQQFERALRSVTSRSEDNPHRRTTIAEEIRRATEAGFIAAGEKEDVRRLLAKRNELVHGELVDDPAGLTFDSGQLAVIVRRMLSREAAWEAATQENDSPQADGPSGQ